MYREVLILLNLSVINYKNIFKYIHSRGFKGVLGMEHGNSRPDEAGEMAVIDAYKQVDNFLSE